MTFDIETDVLVVGAGPAGLAMAASLASLSVRASTVTKYPGTANSPRAHITNQRTMEVFRDLGLEDEVRRVAVPNELMGNNVWATSFAGEEIARLLTWGSGPERHGEYQLASPSEMCNVPQHLLEPVMRRGAEQLGADIRFSMEMVAMTQDEQGVTTTVRQRETGQEQQVRSRYVVGCDGGRSRTAELAGMTMLGEHGLGAAANVWLEADLTKYTSYRPGTLYWICQPGNDFWVGSGTWICVKPWTEWVLLFMYDPNEGDPDMSHEAVLARARTTIGDPDVDIRIKSVSQWQINHVVAATYRAGRVFIAGDAAHRHPPANGLGTNTSIQDAFNLAWKLAYVLRGLAGEELLESYNAERQPVGRTVVDRAMKSVGDMLPISQALGFSLGQSSEAGWATLAELSAAGSEGEERRRKLDEAVQLQNYQFNSLGVELDQHYESAAVGSDGTPWPRPHRDPELHHHPTTHPGAHLPHVWLEHGREAVSTLDLVGHGRFTLLTGIGGEAWCDAASEVAGSLGIPLQSFVIGHHTDYDDVLGRWATVREIEDTGCLLVRPDQHIAYRAVRAVEDPAGILEEVLRRVLDRSERSGGTAG